MAIFSPAACISRSRCRVTALRLLMLLGPVLLCLNPTVGARIEQVQLQDAAAEHLVMKAADVEFRTQLPLRAGAQLAKLQLAEFVRQCLLRPGNIAIRL